MNISFRSSIGVLILWLFVAGCAPNELPPVGTLPVVDITHTKTAETPIVATATRTPIMQPVETATSLPSETPTIAPTVTAHPTLSPGESLELITKLLKPNSECRLPCLWGIIPGRTTWSDAQRFLSTFSTIKLLGKTQDGQIYEVIIPSLEEKGIYAHHFYGIRNDVIESIEMLDPGNAPDFTLKNMFTEFGTPDQVWIRTYSKPYLNQLPFGVAIYYRQLGIVAAYYGDAHLQSQQIEMCLGKVSNPYLGVWDPAGSWEFEKAARRFNWDISSWPFLELEDATSVSIGDFVASVSATSSNYCLRSPSALWEPAQ